MKEAYDKLNEIQIGPVLSAMAKARGEAPRMDNLL